MPLGPALRLSVFGISLTQACKPTPVVPTAGPMAIADSCARAWGICEEINTLSAINVSCLECKIILPGL